MAWELLLHNFSIIHLCDSPFLMLVIYSDEPWADIQAGRDKGNFKLTASGEEYFRDTSSAFWKHLNDPKWFGCSGEVQRHWINRTSLKNIILKTWEMKEWYLVFCFMDQENWRSGRVQECWCNAFDPWNHQVSECMFYYMIIWVPHEPGEEWVNPGMFEKHETSPSIILSVFQMYYI
jgi:hypothetical protein